LQVQIAKKAGFCSGVRRAVDIIIEKAELYGSGSTLGPLVHNEEVTDYLKKRSVAVVDDPDEVQGAFLAIRTHGVTPAIMARAEALQDVAIIDLTCPRVRRVQEIAVELAEKGLLCLRWIYCLLQPALQPLVPN